jgi:acetyl esterase/lipase
MSAARPGDVGGTAGQEAMRVGILDRSRISRPEIRELIDDLQRLRDEARGEFFSSAGNPEVDFLALWARVVSGNERWFRGDRPKGLLARPEMSFLARQHRHAVEFRARALQARDPIPPEVSILPVLAAGVPAEWEVVPDTAPNRVLLYIHGGGYVMGSPNFMRLLGVKLGRAARARVLSVDYRLAPEFPFPAGLDDCLAVYRWLLQEGTAPGDILLAGDSAGGCLALMTLLRARDAGLPMPAGAIGLSPATDLAATGASYLGNAPTDPVLADLGFFWWLEAYLGDAEAGRPSVSPLYADLAGLPPILIQASESEMLLDDARMFHERARDAGVDALLQTWNDTIHVFHQFDLPESVDALARIGDWVDALLKDRLARPRTGRAGSSKTVPEQA